MFNRLVKRVTLGLLCLVFLMTLIWQLGAPAQAQPQRALEAKSILALPQQENAPPPSAKQILVLYTYAGGITVNQKATGAFFSVLTSRGLNNDDVFLEYLDLQRNNSPAYRRRVANLLLDKYGKRDIGLIVTVHTWALEFLLEECKGLFPDVPIFSFLVARPESIKAKNTGRRILLRPQNMDMGGTLEIALKMFPETRRVVFVVGAAPADKRFEHEARHIFEPWRGKVEIEYTSDRTYEEILQLVATLPGRSIVIYCNVFSDVTGRTFTPLEVGKMVANAANAPVFCIWDTIMGWGTIGGSLLSFEAEGAYAAKTALDILDKKIVLTKPETTLPSSKTYMFDWRQLRRWGVNESVLPKGSVLVNHAPTLWEQHKWLIIGGIVLFLAQTLLVIGLLMQRHRKMRAEGSLRRKTEELDQFFNVNLDILCIANTDGYFLRLNPATETILGYTREELTSKQFLDFVHPDDLGRTREAVAALASQQKVFSFENRYRCKDGTYRWLQWSSVPAGKLIYAAARDVTEHKHAEEKIQKAAKEWQTTFDSVRDLVMILDEEFKVARVNAATLSFFNLPLERVVGNHCYTLMHGTSEPVENCPLTKVMEMKKHEETEFYDDKTNAWFHVTVDPICDDKGEITRVVHTVKDITERKQKEELLREKEEAAREMAREASVLAEIGRIVSSTLQIDQIYEAFAAEAKKIIPFDRIVINLIDSEKGTAKNVYMAGEEIQDRTVENLYPLEGSGNAEMLRTKSTFLLQSEDFREYKDRFPMLLSTFEAGFRSIMNVPLFSKGEVIGGLLLRSRKRNAYTDREVRIAESIGNEIAGAIAIGQSFQEQKQMEGRLRESEERFRQVAETVGDFIWEIDANGLYRYTSPSVEKILGYRPDELIGKMYFYDLFLPEVREELKTAAFKVFAAKEAFRGFPNPNTSKNGKVVHLETSGVPVLDETGNLVGYRGADTDVTDRKRAEEEALDARRELLRMDRLSRMGELSASLSHELNQPLTAILSNARAALRFLQANKLDPGELEEILQDIVKDDKRAGDIIRSLRTLVTRDQGERETVSINDVLHETVSLFRSEAIIRNIEIEMDLADPLPLLHVNKVQIQQVVINLMMNAAESVTRDESASKAIVLQTLASHDDVVKVAVRDFGSGIEEPDLHRIFEPFFTTKRSGLGMGLSLSRSIIESHGGHIWAENNADKGITFYFDLPGTRNQ
jgi:PAS domain S-box-containing protein